MSPRRAATSASRDRSSIVNAARTAHGQPAATRALCGERHLHGILKSYFAYYHKARTHLCLSKDAPDPRQAHPPTMGEIVARPEVGGLHHRYERLAA
jgi:hypothetical protein